MGVTRLEVRRRAPFADGTSFGEAGPYERLDGILHFAVDPDHALNQGIVDLDRAPRAPDGRVHFWADFCLLQPADPARAAGLLLFEVPNRGRKGVLGRLNRPAPSGAPAGGGGGMEIGDGLLLRQGWTVAWCGWQWDVLRETRGDGGEPLMGLAAPQAMDGGRPIAGPVLLEWQPDELQRDHLLADRIHHPYPAADVDDPEATLTVREWPDAPRVAIPRERWRFARDQGGTPVPDDTHVWLEGGFQPGRIYELIYRTRLCPVAGTGLLAVRDCVAFLRYGTALDGNPCAGRLTATFGYGSSQSGRFLRTFLYFGLNVDESSRRVFDGLLINVAGARRGEFNHRYAQPSVISARSFGHLPPFGFDGLLARQRARGGVPRIVATNTSSEYWGREASLLHTDEAGTRDVPLPPEVRVYHFAGTKHAPGSLPAPSAMPNGGAPERCVQLANVVDFKPLLRAAFFNLVEWVTRGREPPPSAYPRLADGTAARPDVVLATFHRFPGVRVVDPERLLVNRALDLGPEAARGVGHYPPITGRRYPIYVPAVDEDGNELAGIRLPDVAVPVATHTGWFPRPPATGGEGQHKDMQGATIPFAPTAEARQRSGDPRPSIAERYPSPEAYLAGVRADAERLASQRYLLPEDVDLVVDNAAHRFRAFAGGAACPDYS